MTAGHGLGEAEKRSDGFAHRPILRSSAQMTAGHGLGEAEKRSDGFAHRPILRSSAVYNCRCPQDTKPKNDRMALPIAQSCGRPRFITADDRRTRTGRSRKKIGWLCP